MSSEEDRLRNLLRTVTLALNKCEREYDDSQRALFAARDELQSKQAEVDGLAWHVSELEAENARLQSQADEWRRVAQSKQDVIDHMRDARAENAKLRELVRDMERWCTSGADCTECPFIDECDDAYGEYRACAGWPVIHRRMRELGIEVGDD